jgi:hypothetical protein
MRVYVQSLINCGAKPWFDASLAHGVAWKTTTAGCIHFHVSFRPKKKENEELTLQVLRISGIPMTKKKIMELELSLVHPQQNVGVPGTHLITLPMIQKAVERVQATGTRPTINNIPPKCMSDSTFLNTLCFHVNRWTRSIKAVMKLGRDVVSGINFWPSLGRVPEGIESQLQGEGALTIIDCPQNAEWYHATVSSVTDT